MKATAVILSWKRQHNLPVIIKNLLEQEFIDEIIVVDNSKGENRKTLARYEAAKRARNDLIYFQDDDCIVHGIKTLYEAFLSHPEAIAHGATPELMRVEHKNHHSSAHMAMAGWGSFFKKEWIDFSPYTDVYGEDDCLIREADRIFSMLLNRKHTTELINIEHLRGFDGAESMASESGHNDFKKLAMERCEKILGLHKFGAVVNVMREKDLLPGCLSLLDRLDNVVCVFSSVSYSGKPVKDDGSINIARDHGAHIIETDTANQAIMRNEALEYLQNQGIDYAFIIDTDEWYPRKTMGNILAYIEETQLDAYKIKLTHMFRKPNWSVPTRIDGGSIMCMKTNMRFPEDERRNLKTSQHLIPESVGPVYHFSYVRSPDKIKEKIENFSHSHEVVDGWFEGVFLPCTIESKKVHPTNPSAWPEIVEVELSDDVSALMPEHLW